MDTNVSKWDATIVLLGNPRSTNSIYRHARGISYMAKEGKELKTSYKKQALSQWKNKPLEGRLEIEVLLFFGNKRVHDWDNFHKLSMDALTGILWNDDSQIWRTTVEMFYDKEQPRIQINVKQRGGTQNTSV